MVTIVAERPLGTATIIYEKLTTDYATSLKPLLTSLEFVEGTYDDHKVRRAQRWYQTENRYINPHWPIYDRWKPHEYEPELLTLQSVISKHVNKKLDSISTLTPSTAPWEANSLLINKYESGLNIISKHRDSEYMFGDNPTIAVLSVGATRTLRFTPITPASRSMKSTALTLKEIIDIEVESNSLLIMAGTTQKYFCHELLKDESVEETRFSLTFRNHVL